MKSLRNLLVVFLCSWTMLVQTGCYGSFKLTNNLYDWNGTISNKFLRSLVFLALIIVPVYEIAAFVDVVLLNLIEFWSGSNPVSMNPGDKEEQLVRKNGVDYKMTATRNHFRIECLSGSSKGKTVDLEFTPDNMTWNVCQGDQLTPVSTLCQNPDGSYSAQIHTSAQSTRMISLPSNEGEMAEFRMLNHLNSDVALIR